MPIDPCCDPGHLPSGPSRPVKRLYGRRPRRGFILLMSLVLIALAGIILVGLARHSLIVAAESHEATRDLQRRWGQVFLSQALLANPEKLIARRFNNPAVQTSPLPIRKTFTLGQLEFHVTLDDENRKLNINRLRVAGGTPEMLKTIHQHAGGVRVELKPVSASALGVRQFDSWGHVLNLAPSNNVRDQFNQVRPLSQVMTCWGNAKVNVARCSDEVLHSATVFSAGPITANRLVALRESEPQLDCGQLLTKLAINRRKQALLQGWLSDHSGCYSLWVLAGEHRATLDLYIREDLGSESYSTKHFRW